MMRRLFIGARTRAVIGLAAASSSSLSSLTNAALLKADSVPKPTSLGMSRQNWFDAFPTSPDGTLAKFVSEGWAELAGDKDRIEIEKRSFNDFLLRSWLPRAPAEFLALPALPTFDQYRLGVPAYQRVFPRGKVIEEVFFAFVAPDSKYEWSNYEGRMTACQLPSSYNVTPSFKRENTGTETSDKFQLSSIWRDKLPIVYGGAGSGKSHAVFASNTGGLTIVVLPQEIHDDDTHTEGTFTEHVLGWFESNEALRRCNQDRLS